MQGARPFDNRLLQFFHKFLIYDSMIPGFVTHKKTAEALFDLRSIF